MKTFYASLLFLILLPAAVSGQAVSTGRLGEDHNTIRILEGDNSDPSIIRHGDCYYLAEKLLGKYRSGKL